MEIQLKVDRETKEIEIKWKTTPTETDIEATSKDYMFYQTYFIKILDEKQKELIRWKNYTEKQMEAIVGDGDIYTKQEEGLNDLNRKIEVIKREMCKDMDSTNILFIQYVKEQLFIKQKQVLNSKRKKETEQVKKDKQDAFIKKFYANESSHNRQNRQTLRDMNYYHNRMLDIDRQMPDYMKNALNNMPQNKGYIFRGVWYFGHIPLRHINEEKLLTMFETVKGIQYIHEYYYDFPYKRYRLYQKLSKTHPKTLVKEDEFEMR